MSIVRARLLLLAVLLAILPAASNAASPPGAVTVPARPVTLRPFASVGGAVSA